LNKNICQKPLFFGTDFPNFITAFPSQQPSSPSNLLTPQTISVFSRELKERLGFTYYNVYISCNSKGKAVLLQAWSGPEGSRKLRFPDIMTTTQDGGKVFTPRKYTWY